MRPIVPFPRFRGCGRHVIGLDGLVAIKVADGVAHFAGLLTCGLVWVCPVCSAKIRYQRSLEVEAMLTRAVELGYGVEFITLTARHHRGQRLKDLFGQSEAAWAAMRRDKSFRQTLERFGLRFITVREVTFGEANGWHPHRHIAAVTAHPLSSSEREALGEALWRAWSHQLGRVGLSAERGPGVVIRAVTGPEGLASYLCKVSDERAAMELVRSDLKSAGVGHRSPEQILGDLADLGEVGDLVLLREYWAATKGRRMMTYSQGLRAELLGEDEEPSDEELAALDQGGEVVARISRRAWALVLAVPGGPVALLEAAEEGRGVLASWLAGVCGAEEWSIVMTSEGAGACR